MFINEFDEIFGSENSEQSFLYPLIKINRGDDQGKVYGFELSYDQWQHVLTSPDIKWENAPHPGNKNNGTDKAYMLRQMTLLPIAKIVTWQYAVATGEGDNKSFFSLPRHCYAKFNDVSITSAGVTKMLCLSREIPNVPFVLQTRGMVSKSLNEILDPRDLFYQIVEKHVTILSKRTVSTKDFVVPLKVSPKKDTINGGWFRRVMLNLSDEQIEAFNAIESFDQFNASPFAKMLMATEEEEAQVAAMQPAGEEWLEREKQFMVNTLKTNPYANFLFNCTKQKSLAEHPNLVAVLQANDCDPTKTMQKLINELQHESNVKQLTA